MRVATGLTLGLLGLGAFATACSGDVGSGEMGVMPTVGVPGAPAPGATDMGGVPIAGPAPAMTDAMGNPVPVVPPGTGTPTTPAIDPSTGLPVATPVPAPVATDPVTGEPVAPTPTPTDPAACTATDVQQGLVLLSDIQFVNGIRSAMGDAALTADNLPVEERKPFSRKVLALNTSLVVTRMDWAEDAGMSVVGRVPEVTGCQLNDDACAQTYLEDLATRAFRRAVTPAEVTELMAVFAVGSESDYETGIRLAIEAVLSSPSFFYRTEFGAPAADGSLQLTATELASALSYLLTDHPPDDGLLASGIDGTLSDPAVLGGHVDRLLASEETRNNLTSTMMAAWSFGNLADVVKDEMLFPTFNGLRALMYEETKLFLRDVMWNRNVDISEVLSSPTTFVDSRLAELYGVPFPGADPNEFVQVTLPADQRAGILTHASVMSARSRTDKTSVVSRGIFVRGDLLCLAKIALPDGDPELAALIAEQDENVTLTEKQKADERAETSPCNTCHRQFDQFGVPLEYYDPIGRYVAQTDDTTVDLSLIGGLMPASPTASNGVELAQALATTPQFRACVTRHVLSYGLGADELLANSCEVQQAASQLATPATMTDIVKAVATSPALRTRTAEAAQ